jgi:hypothetical protein
MGDVNAALEYREWMALQGDALSGDAWIEALLPADRVLVREAVARAVEKAARAQGVARETPGLQLAAVRGSSAATPAPWLAQGDFLTSPLLCSVCQARRGIDVVRSLPRLGRSSWYTTFLRRPDLET